ncbi:MAG: Required for respiratory growth protein 9 mitochondrial [Thelocarpon impressellum]|nr:MAG: Required for respiratory growth protein 9 mitochondrial [Thelocarpon impressellum]
MACRSCSVRALQVFLKEFVSLGTATRPGLSSTPLRQMQGRRFTSRPPPRSYQSTVHDAIADLSPESIDALAAESTISPPHPSSQDLPARRPSAPPLPSRRSPLPREAWQVQKAALTSKFAAWAPRKRLSPDALAGIRALHAQYPDTYTTPVLAAQFEVSAEAIRRILKSRWRPSEAEEEARRVRWEKRGERIWGRMGELGVKPPRKWRELGLGRRTEGAAEGRERRRGSREWGVEEREREAEEPYLPRESLAERIL